MILLINISVDEVFVIYRIINAEITITKTLIIFTETLIIFTETLINFLYISSGKNKHANKDYNTMGGGHREYK